MRSERWSPPPKAVADWIIMTGPGEERHRQPVRNFRRLAVYLFKEPVTIPAQALGGNSAQRRHVRVATPPVIVRIAGSQGRLVNVSASGALVQIQRDLETQRVWPLIIETEPDPLELRVRVIRSQPVSIELPHATWRRQEFAVAVAFTALHDRGRELLAKLCGPAFTQFE